MTARFALITDTTADLSEALAQEHNIYLIPQVIVWGREILKDGVSITSPQFYARLKTASEMPTTSRPAPVDVATLYQQAMDETKADCVVVLTVSQDVSGTYPSAIEAMKMVDFPVHVLDTRTITLALGMTTLKIATARDEGISPEDAAGPGQADRQHQPRPVLAGYPGIPAPGRPHRRGPPPDRDRPEHQAHPRHQGRPGDRRGKRPHPQTRPEPPGGAS